MRVLKIGIYLTIFCLPLYLIRFRIFNVPTTILEMMIYALFLLWLANKGYRNLPIILKEKLLVWGIILLVVGVSAAFIFSWNLRVSAGIWKAWFIDAILFFVIFATTIEAKDIKKVLNAFIFSGFVVAVISLIYLIQGNLNFQGRLQGIFDSPNYLAMYLAVPLVLSLWRFLRFSRRINLNFLLLLAICILFLAILFFTKSYGAWLGVLAALVAGAMIYLYGRNKKKLALLLIICVFALVFILGIIKIQSLEGLKSFDARFVIWEKAIESFKNNFPIGIGPGTFEDYFPLYPKWGVPQPHNLYLAFLLQTGIVGFVGFVLILIWFFMAGFKKMAINQWSLVILCMMIYVLAHGLADTTYWKNDLSLIFWTIMGAMAIL